MSAHQALLTPSRSYHILNSGFTGGTGNYYSPEGCSAGVEGYISGSQGSITNSTFRGLNITEFACYTFWTEQNDSQNQDPYEWYCAQSGQYTVFRISGATSQFFFKRIFNDFAELKAEDAIYTSGSWEWPGNGLFGSFFIEY